MTAKRERALRAVWDAMVRAGWIDDMLDQEDAPKTEVEEAWRDVRAFIDAYLEAMREPGPDEVRVRVAVAVDAEGDYSADGSGNDRYDSEKIALDGLECSIQPIALYWIEATVKRPKAETVEGEAEE